MHKVKIESLGVPYAKILLDGKTIKCSKVDVHMEIGCVPQTDIYFRSDPELDYETLVTVDFSPKTVTSAVNVLKQALKRNDFTAFMGMNSLIEVMNKRNE